MMSTAPLVVNYGSHKLQTCIRRNVKFYPVTMHKIVLTSSAMWLFEMIKKSDGLKRFCDVITGDETWLYYYGTRNEQSNQMWVAADGKRPVVLRPGFQGRKRLFSFLLLFSLSTHGPVIFDIIPLKSTLTETYSV